jgi:oligosaccharide repeat unit polymerase
MVMQGKRYYLIDHKLLFLFGYVFYLFTPFIVGKYSLFEGFPGMELYQGFYNRIPDQKLMAYLLITLSWLPAFFLGHFCFKLIRPWKRSLQLFPPTVTSYGMPYVAILLFFVLAVFIYIARNSLFGGYRTYDVGARGKLSTLMVIFNFFLLYQLVSRQKVSFLLVTGTILTSIILLTMGGRLYVIQTFLTYLIYKTSFASKRWKAWQIIAFAILILLVASSLGVWRMGSAFTLDNNAYSLLAEPAFTWFSTSTFLISNEIPVFNIPWNFLTSFLNMIPNTFISLRSYVIAASAMGYTYENPLGADSVWTNYIINFGWAGSVIFIFITGFMLNLLRHLSENNRFWAVYYILVCGMIPFQFFRDGFFIINKQLFFNFLFIPGLILIALKVLHYLLNVKNKTTAVTLINS